MASPPQERRKYKRIKRPFMAKFRVYQGTGARTSRKWDIVRIRNLSAIGISFNYDKKINLGAVLELQIILGIADEPIRCLGVVSRIDESSSQSNGTGLRKIPVHGIAVRFTEIESDKQEAIDRYIKKLHLGRK